jgi:hypothetical protein
MLWLPPCIIGYGWMCDKHLNVAVICVMLVLVGFTSMCVERLFMVMVVLTSSSRWMYAGTLAYLVDANPGRSAAAVATNSSFRGSLAFISAIIAVPLQVGFRVACWIPQILTLTRSCRRTLGEMAYCSRHGLAS